MRISDWSSDVCSSDLTNGITYQSDILAWPYNPRLADGQDKIVKRGNIETAAIEQFVFKKYHRIGTADRCFQQTLGIRRIIGRNNDEARHRGIPRPVILAMLSRHAGSCAIRPAENHGKAHLRSEEHTSELQSLMRLAYAACRL